MQNVECGMRNESKAQRRIATLTPSNTLYFRISFAESAIS